MLLNLRIQDLILIENLDVPFESGFNVLSGETGSGKSALMTALSLILGKRADSAVVRKGMDKARIEGVFASSAALCRLLSDVGIEGGDELIIRREIAANGKSRAFVNDQPVTLNFLKEIGQILVKSVGQHANQQLMSCDTHRALLDQFGSCPVKPFAESYHQLCEIERQLRELQQSQAALQREIDLCFEEIEEIQTVDPRPGEDDELFSEYTILTHAEEFQQVCHRITEALSGDGAVIDHLNELNQSFQDIVKIDPKFQEQHDSYRQTVLELQEMSHLLERAKSTHEYNPSRLAEVNDRMGVLHALKRKYGGSLEAVLSHVDERRRQLKRLENRDLSAQACEKQIAEKKKECDSLARDLSEQRRRSARRLEKEIVTHLKDLNMPSVEFHIVLTPQQRTEHGDEKVEFFLRPNKGEKEVSVVDCASGGELSRLMLSFQVMMAGKEQIPTIVFDEIDANIGGSTAVSVGSKLKEIGRQHQVLCITHFPQVATQADYHLQISKEEIDGRTMTFVQRLDEESRGLEIQRMQGLKT